MLENEKLNTLLSCRILFSCDVSEDEYEFQALSNTVRGTELHLSRCCWKATDTNM